MNSSVISPPVDSVFLTPYISFPCSQPAKSNFYLFQSSRVLYNTLYYTAGCLLSWNFNLFLGKRSCLLKAIWVLFVSLFRSVLFVIGKDFKQPKSPWKEDFWLSDLLSIHTLEYSIAVIRTESPMFVKIYS